MLQNWTYNFIASHADVLGGSSRVLDLQGNAFFIPYNRNFPYLAHLYVVNVWNFQNSLHKFTENTKT